VAEPPIPYLRRAALTPSQRAIPGNARKWQVLAWAVKRGGSFTVRDVADVYGYRGPVPPVTSGNNSPWQVAISNAASDLRLLNHQGCVRRAGKVATPVSVAAGWGAGNPTLWSVTPKGRAVLAAVLAQRDERLGRDEAIRAARVAKRSTHAADYQRTSALAAAARDLLASNPGMTLRERNQLAAWLHSEGLTYAVIAGVLTVGPTLTMTPEGARRAALAGTRRQ
jgi:hypothetical protein